MPAASAGDSADGADGDNALGTLPRASTTKKTPGATVVALDKLERALEKEPEDHAQRGQRDNSHEVDSVETLTGWLVVVSAWSVLFILLGMVYTYGVLYPALIDEFNASKGTTALAGTLSVGIMNTLGFLSAPVIDRLGFQGTLRVGAVVFSGALFLTSFSASINHVVALYGGLGGVGAFFLFCPAFPVVNFWFDRRRALAVGLVVSGSGVGQMVVGPVMQALIDSSGWRLALRYLAGATLLLVVLASFGIFLPPAVMAERKAATVAGKRKPVPIDLLLFRDPVFRVCTGSFFFCSFGYLTPFVHAVKLARNHGASDELSSQIVLVIGVANTIGRVMAGHVADAAPRFLARFGVEVSRARTRELTFSVSMGLGGIAVALMPHVASNFAALATFAGLFAFFGGAFVAMFGVLLADQFGVKRSVGATGMSQVVFAIGTFVGAPISGWIYDAAGDYVVAFLVAGGCLLTGGCIMPLTARFHSHPEHLRQLELFK